MSVANSACRVSPIKAIALCVYHVVPLVCGVEGKSEKRWTDYHFLRGLFFVLFCLFSGEIAAAFGQNR